MKLANELVKENEMILQESYIKIAKDKERVKIN